MKLIGYFRSSAAFRVRIALNLKGIAVEHAFRHLRKGEQRAPDYAAINPQKLVPALVLDSGEVLTQSMAILEYLEETHPDPPLLPRIRSAAPACASLALIPTADIHPIQNLRVMAYLREKYDQSEEGTFAWSRHWIETGFEAYEASIAGNRAHRRLQPWRSADHGRSLPGAAGLQRRALQGRHVEVPDHPAHPRHLPEAPGVRRGAAFQAAGRRTVKKLLVCRVRRSPADRRRSGRGSSRGEACRGANQERDGARRNDDGWNGRGRPARAPHPAHRAAVQAVRRDHDRAVAGFAACLAAG